MANRTTDLTPKQLCFARAVLAGKSLSDAYKQCYNADRMSVAAVHVEASRLMANPKVTLRVHRLQRQRDQAAVVSNITDRERVLTKLRTILDTEKGGPEITAQLRAAELLGRSVGIFKDIVETKHVRTYDEVAAELEKRLAAIEDEPDTAMH